MTNVLDQVGRRAAPVGMEEPVDAVPGDRHRLHACADRRGALPQVGSRGGKQTELGKVIAHQPELRSELVVPLEHDDAVSDTTHFTEPGDRVRPVVV
jgi:hypothetical protein